MKYKLVALDLDGTLLDDENNISDITCSYIKELQKRGILFTIVTGRMYCSALNIAKKIGIENNFLISYNGALIKRGEQIMSHIPVKESVYNHLIQKIDQDLLIFISDRLYVKKHSPQVKEYTDRAKVFANDYFGSDYHKERATKFIIIPKDDFNEYEKKIAKTLGKDAYVTHSTKRFLEIMNPSVSKANALKTLCEFNHILLDETIAFGDGMNDKEMLTEAGLGIAMGNSWEAVKDCADDNTLSNNEDGVYHYLKNIFG